MSVYLETSNEPIDGSLNQSAQFSEGSEHKRSFENLNISKSYIEGRMDVLVFFRVAGKLYEYVAFFRNRQRAYQRDTDRLFLGGRTISKESGSEELCNFRIADAIVYSLDTLSLGEDEIVLIGDVHSVKPPKSIIPSEIWLMKVDEILVGEAHTLYLSRSTSYVLGGTLANRKVCIGCDGASVIPNECSRQVIQSRSEIVDGVTNNQTNDGIDLGYIFNHILGVCRMRIVLGPKFARAYLEKGFSPHIEIIDVVVGPVDF